MALVSHVSDWGEFPVTHMKRKFECMLLYYFLFLSSASWFVYQMWWHILSHLCDNACKRTMVTIWESVGHCFLVTGLYLLSHCIIIIRNQRHLTGMPTSLYGYTYMTILVHAQANTDTSTSLYWYSHKPTLVQPQTYTGTPTSLGRYVLSNL